MPIDVGLEIVEGLRIGTGLPDHEGEVLLLVQRNGVAHVPGGSLKGARRSWLSISARRSASSPATTPITASDLPFGWSPGSGGTCGSTGLLPFPGRTPARPH